MDLLNEMGKLQRISFIFFLLFVFLQCLSIAAANVALGISVFFLVLHLIKCVKEGFPEEIKNNLRKYRSWFLIFGYFWLSMLLSALFSGDVSKGLKVFFGQYVYRTVPFFIIVLFFSRSKQAALILFLALSSCVIDIVAAFSINPQTLRLKGLFGHPMTLAGFLCISIPAMFCFLMDWKQKKSALACSAFFFFIAFIGLLLNGTRGAWLALLISLPLTGLLLDRSIKKILFLCVLLFATGLTFINIPHLHDRAQSITSETLQSNTERILMWKSAFQMFEDHPIFGVGLGQYSTKYRNEYISPEAKERKQNHAHSNVMQMLGENGIIGLTAFLVFFGFIFYQSLRAVFKRKTPYGALLFGSTFAFFLQGLTEFNFGNSAVIKYYWVFLGVSLVLMSYEKTLLPLFDFSRPLKNASPLSTTRKRDTYV